MWRDMSADNWRSKQRVREVHSLGVACCRFNGTKPEILMVCKRFTYAYHTFVSGKYNSSNNADIIALLNDMTIDEKIDLQSLNFAYIWYRIWLSTPYKTSNYFLAKSKFETAFVVNDGGVRLKQLITRSQHANKIWEIPKGRRKNKSESDINCAMREFTEETGVAKKMYKIFAAQRKYSYIDAGVMYTNTYFLGITSPDVEPRIDLSSTEQYAEIADVRWMDIEAIRRIDDTKMLERFIKPVFNYMKKYAKN
jgi:8-oxo-dGTP pyrophosphatase MutT (NUDIX family)